MNKAKLQPPKRKHRVYCPKEAPFPVPLESLTGIPAKNTRWRYYTGHLVGDHVLVKHTGDMEHLYLMGFFGKGTLSDRGPGYGYQSSQNGSSGPHMLRVISKRQYLQRLSWKKQTDGEEEQGSGLMEEYSKVTSRKRNFSQTDDSDPIEINKHNIKCEKSHQMDCDETEVGENWDNFKYDEACDDVWSGDNRTRENTEIDKDDWPITGAAESWDIQPAGSRSGDDWGTSEVTESWDLETPDETKELESFQRKPEEEGPCESETEPIPVPEKLSDDSKRSDVAINQQEVDKKVEICEDVSVERVDDAGINEETNQSEQVEEPVRTDPRSVDDDEDEAATLLVQADSDAELPDAGLWRTCKKEDPYPIKEDLLLSLEEAFFLVYGLGCLIVFSEDQSPLDVLNLWQYCCQCDPQFVPRYVTYHHFRSKGWVPNTGLKFGADYVLYKEGPPFYHSSYSVLIQVMNSDLTPDLTWNRRCLNWFSLGGMHRITEQVSKEVMLLNVIKPKDFKQEDTTNPSCMSKFKVKEVIFKRWVPSEEREKRDK